jgi:hypothetical protein
MAGNILTNEGNGNYKPLSMGAQSVLALYYPAKEKTA